MSEVCQSKHGSKMPLHLTIKPTNNKVLSNPHRMKYHQAHKQESSIEPRRMGSQRLRRALCLQAPAGGHLNAQNGPNPWPVEAQMGQKRLQSTKNGATLPVNTTPRFQCASYDEGPANGMHTIRVRGPDPHSGLSHSRSGGPRHALCWVWFQARWGAEIDPNTEN